jgi:hypothetical protein
MTIPEAQLLVKRWGRILFFGLDLPDTFAARAMERSFLGIAIGPLPALFIAAACGPVPFRLWPLRYMIPASVIMALSYWLSLRFRVARLLFEAADARRSPTLI